MKNEMFPSSIVSSLHAWSSSSWIAQSYVPDVLRTLREKQQEMIATNLIGIAMDETPDTFGRKVIATIITTWKYKYMYTCVNDV
jgi:hypothetical protein